VRTFSQLLEIIKDTISLPIDDEDRWNATAVLGALNRALDEKVMPDLLRFANEYLVVRQLIPLTNASGQTRFPDGRIPIPARAYANVLREVKWLAEGKTSRIDENNVTISSITEFDQVSRRFAAGLVQSAYIENNTLVLNTDPANLKGSLVFYYFLRQPDLKSDLVVPNIPRPRAIVTGFSGDNITVSKTNWPAGETASAYYGYDIIATNSSSFIFSDIIVQYLNATSYLPISDTPTNVQQTLRTYTSNSYQAALLNAESTLGLGLSEIEVVNPQNCYFTYLPDEFDYLLCYHTCSKILESLGDEQGLAMNEQRVDALYNKLKNVYATRVKGQRRKVADKRGLGRFQKLNSPFMRR
jgi:hypothetical protein